MGITLIVSAAMGCAVGWLFSFIFKDRANLLRNMLCGIVGGLIGGVAVSLADFEQLSWLIEIIVAAIGAFIFVFIISKTANKTN